MSAELEDYFVEAIDRGLTRKSLKSCSIWAKKCRIIKEDMPWDFPHHPWLEHIHNIANRTKRRNALDIESHHRCIQKSAQMGLTETLINICFFTICELKEDVLYILPTKTPDVTDFSTGRLDTAIALSPYLETSFSTIRNVTHKKAGNINLYIRGASSHLKSIPVSTVIGDEVDEFPELTMPRVRERMMGQFVKSLWEASTPSIPDHGINISFEDSTQNHYVFVCPYCSRQTELLFPDCLVITANDHKDPAIKGSHYICNECKHILPQETKTLWLNRDNAHWEPAHPGRLIDGYYINQFYSITAGPVDMAVSHLKAQSDPVEEQEYWNNKGGLPHVVADARITDDIWEDLHAAYKNGDRLYKKNALTTIGVDIGNYVHITVYRWTIGLNMSPIEISYNAVGHIVCATKIRNVSHNRSSFKEIEDMILAYNPHKVVVDAQPEKRAAFDLANRWPGLVYVCFYETATNPKNEWRVDHNQHVITVDRTAFLDRMYGRIRAQKITIPVDTPLEFKNNMKALVRVSKKTREGNIYSTYQKGKEQDHYAHSCNYNEVALTLCAFRENESFKN